MNNRMRLFDFYGFRMSVSIPKEMEMPALDSEFSFFEKEWRPEEHSDFPADCQVELINEEADYTAFGSLKPRYYTPRNICYHHDGQKIVNYHGDALLTQNASGTRVRLLCTKAKTAEAILYSIILYQSGVHLERRGLHRVHSLAFSYRGKAVMVLLPMGGGKSTLLFELLREPDVKLISEDTPLLGANGRISPFPVKLGLLPGKVPEEVPQSMITQMHHLEGQVKDIVDLSYLGGRIEREALPLAAVIIGERYLGNESDVRRVSAWRAWRSLFRDCVVGLGVYQGLEFAVMRGLGELLALLTTAMKRSRVCASTARNVPAYEFQMGCAIPENTRRLKAFLDSTFSQTNAS